MKFGPASDWSAYRNLHNKINAMLRSAKAAYFHDLASSLKNAPGKFWRHFQSLSRCSKPACEIQVSAMADVFNDHFLSIPYKTISNVVSAVPASEYMDRFCDLTVPTLEFVPVDVETVSLIISSL